MRSIKVGLIVAAAFGFAACADETPVELGDLLPGGGVRTIEVVFDAPAFLEWDSVRTGFSTAATAGFGLIAEKHGGALDAHALLRFSALPSQVSYRDSAGDTKIDSIPRLIGGSIVLRLDTLRTVRTQPVDVALYRVAEGWDARSASWTHRVDTAAVKLPWAEAGGSRDALIGTAKLAPGDSVLTLPVDSATLALWKDTTALGRGVLVRANTPGARIEFTSAKLRIDVRPSARDTVVTDSAQLRTMTFVHQPAAEAGGALVVGGVPTWRTFLRFKERLDTLKVQLDTLSAPCPRGPGRCTLRLGEVSVNFAGIELFPVAPPAGHAPVDTMVIDPRAVLPTAGVPLARAPVSVSVGQAAKVAPSAFNAGRKVEVPVTALVLAMVGDSTNRANAPRTLALLGYPEAGSFGVGTFGSLSSGALAPRLRLILSVTSEVQLR